MRGGTLVGITVTTLAACSPPAEDACTLSFERVARFSPPGEEGYVGYAWVSPELVGGRRAVTELGRGEFAIVIHDASGRFLDTLGKVGAGPGEYRHPQLVLPYRRDSVLIVDRLNARATVLDSTLRVVRTFPLSFPAIWGVALADGSLALSHGVSRGGHRTGRFNSVGEPLGDVPNPWAGRESHAQEAPLLSVGSEPDGTWWTLSLDQRFEFRHYDSRDSLLAAWGFPEDLLPSYEGRSPVSPTTPPKPAIGAGYIDGRGRLWTFASVADSQWAEGLGERQMAEGQEYWPTIKPHALRDGLVIVADAATGQVLRTWRLDSVPGHPIEPGILLTGTEDDDGWFHPELRRVVPSPACGL